MKKFNGIVLLFSSIYVFLDLYHFICIGLLFIQTLKIWYKSIFFFFFLFFTREFDVNVFSSKQISMNIVAIANLFRSLSGVLGDDLFISTQQRKIKLNMYINPSCNSNFFHWFIFMYTQHTNDCIYISLNTTRKICLFIFENRAKWK